MPFTRTQSILKKLLPKWGFTLLYKLAHRGYRAWCKISEKLNCLLPYVYYVLKRDSRNAKRIKAVYSLLPYTLVGRTGLLDTYDIASEIEKNNIGGCFVECGVAKGGCSACMALVANDNKSNRKTWLFDSFEGLPEHTIEDEHSVQNHTEEDKYGAFLHKGYCLGTYDAVSKLLFSMLGLNKENIW